MVRRLNGRHAWLAGCASLLVLAMALPASAQSTGMVRGVVKDASGKPSKARKSTSTLKPTTVISIPSRIRRASSSKSACRLVRTRSRPRRTSRCRRRSNITVRIAAAAPVTLVIGAGGGASPEVAAKNAELKKTFEEGVAASRAGNHDAAIASFTHAAELNAACYDCYYNIAFSESQKKDYDKAEAAYKKAIEIKPDYAEAYSGLATVYNQARKFDEAAAASAKAMELSGSGAAGGAGGGNADAMFNQGVILWNAGKIPEAKKQFEGAIAANPNHAESHYQLGMALVNEGNLAGATTEFETYLKLAPTGPNAATAKGILGTLKK